ncbi:MAG: YcaO-like family protein [Magnetococcales bacterium]|nr:YcaO-like family protein [Magnetococcales bacterium]
MKTRDLQNVALSHPCLMRGLHRSYRLGPLVRQSFHRMPEGYDMLHAVTASVKDVTQKNEVVAAGGGLTRDRAFFAAVGEALERLSLRQHQHLSLSSKPFENKDSEIDPFLFLQGLINEIPPLVPWQSDQEIFWIEGRDLDSDAVCHIPAFAIFPSAQAHNARGDLLFANTSTGTAASRDKKAAILSGIYEVVERDAFITHWENRWSGVDQPLDTATWELARKIESRGFKVSIRALGTDTGIPVALAAVSDLTGYRAATALGAAARATWEDASFRALEEALLTSFWISTRLYVEGVHLNEAREKMAGLPEPSDHALLHGFHESRDASAFLFDASDRTKVSFAPPPAPLDVSGELDWALARILSVHERCIHTDITHPSAAALGLYVTRVVIPGFLPLTRGDARPVLHPRLVSTAGILGRSHLKNSGFNPVPHPFP